jgi:hypothetical protein
VGDGAKSHLIHTTPSSLESTRIQTINEKQDRSTQTESPEDNISYEILTTNLTQISWKTSQHLS